MKNKLSSLQKHTWHADTMKVESENASTKQNLAAEVSKLKLMVKMLFNYNCKIDFNIQLHTCTHNTMSKGTVLVHIKKFVI